MRIANDSGPCAEQPDCTSRIPYDALKIQALGKLSPIRLVMQIGIEWVLVFLAIALCNRYYSIASYTLAVVFIAGRQHALGALSHEIAHYHLSRKSKMLNDVVGDIFLAFPLFISIHGYRRQHFAHHVKLGSAADPDWARTQNARFSFPKSKLALWLEIAKCLSGYRALHDVREALIKEKLATNLPWRVHALRALFFVGAVAAIWYWKLWWDFLAYWLVPMNTVLIFLLYWRLVAEHCAIPGLKMLGTRTVKPGILQMLVAAPNGINFHLEHHMFAHVPFHNLGKLHHYLMSIPEYSNRAHVTAGYGSSLVSELTKHRHADQPS